MARPSVWRAEFQHVENEYMTAKKKTGRSLRLRSALRIHGCFTLQIGVAGAQHGGEAGGFHLAASALAGLLKMPVAAHFLQRALAIDLLLQSPQRLVNRLAFL
jgi:hypothetical protein